MFLSPPLRQGSLQLDTWLQSGCKAKTAFQKSCLNMHTSMGGAIFYSLDTVRRGTRSLKAASRRAMRSDPCGVSDRIGGDTGGRQLQTNSAQESDHARALQAALLRAGHGQAMSARRRTGQGDWVAAIYRTSH